MSRLKARWSAAGNFESRVNRPKSSHTDRWVLIDSPDTEAAREWVTRALDPASAAAESARGPSCL